MRRWLREPVRDRQRELLRKAGEEAPEGDTNPVPDLQAQKGTQILDVAVATQLQLNCQDPKFTVTNGIKFS